MNIKYLGIIGTCLFIISFTASFLFTTSKTPLDMARGYDLAIFNYGAKLIEAGANPYDPTSLPEIRNQELDVYMNNPPLNIYLEGKAVKVMSLPWLFLLANALIPVVIFGILTILGKVRLLPAITISLVGYGLNPVPLVYGQLFSEDKAIYTLLLLLLMGFILWLEKKPSKPLGWQLGVLSFSIGFLIGFKLALMYFVPIYLVYLVAKKYPLKEVVTQGLLTVIVAALSFLPYFPSSLMVIQDRLNRAHLAPLHASIFRLLPWVPNLHTMLLIVALVGIGYLLWKSKISLALSLGLTLVASLVLSTDGGLDRDLFGIVPLMVVLGLAMPWKVATISFYSLLIGYYLILLPWYNYVRGSLIFPINSWIDKAAMMPQYQAIVNRNWPSELPDAVFALIMSLVLVGLTYLWLRDTKKEASLR